MIDRLRRRRTGGFVDKTFNRVTRKLEDGETIRDLPTYCNGVARLVSLQSLERDSNIRNWFSVDRVSVYTEPIFLGGMFNTYSTLTLSRFGPPAAVVDVTRNALNAELTGKLTLSVVVL